MKFLILFVALYVACAVDAQVTFGDMRAKACNSKKMGAIVKKFELVGCKSQPCTFERGKNATLNIEFTPTRRINNLKLDIVGVLGTKEVPFSAGEGDHCKQAVKSGKCPLQRNKLVKYSNSIQVLDGYPQISLSVRYTLKDHSNQQIFCAEWQTKIV